MTCRNKESNLDQVIIKHVNTFLSEMNVHRDVFAKDYLINKLMAAGVLSEEPSDLEDFVKWQRTNLKRVERILKCDTPLPSSFVFSFIAALPDPYKTKCMHEICGAFGSHYMPLAPISGTVDIKATKARLTDISKEFADVLQCSAPAMDGEYDSSDSNEDLQRLSNELFELTASTYVEIEAIHNASGVLPSAYVAMHNSPLFKK